MMLAGIFKKTYRFNFQENHSPTQHQLALFLQCAGLKSTRRPCLAHFSDRHLNFSPDACECLEFKHLLAQLVQRYCPAVMPETYLFDASSWVANLNRLADAHYMTHRVLSDKIENMAWILKPALLNNGQHIKIFDHLSQIESHYLQPNHLSGPHVLQRYITDPDLIDGRKYSLRFFVVITREAGAFLYPQGYLNVALAPYAAHDFNALNAHLTNEHLHHQDVSVEQIPTSTFASWYPQIQSIVKSVTSGLESAFPYAFTIQKKRTFAVFGFDFMIDKQKRVWLLEANHGPCFPMNEDHPLQQSLYRPFWEAMVKQFVLPITTGEAMNRNGCAGFESMR
ncbi:MAG TPA: tubulin-tyrosine ligase [Legionella sp.]|nr:tubulin-tyrosine ligase [Legionella sp.]